MNNYYNAHISCDIRAFTIGTLVERMFSLYCLKFSLFFLFVRKSVQNIFPRIFYIFFYLLIELIKKKKNAKRKQKTVQRIDILMNINLDFDLLLKMVNSLVPHTCSN